MRGRRVIVRATRFCSNFCGRHQRNGDAVDVMHGAQENAGQGGSVGRGRDEMLREDKRGNYSRI